MKIRIIAVGGLKERFFMQAQAEYAKRLTNLCSLEIIELEPSPVPKPGNAAQIAAALEDEGKRILEKVGGGRLIALCVEGKKPDSAGFAKLVSEAQSSGCTALCFAIGSSCGLSAEVKNAAAARISFSEMTFPHRLFRVMLLEQLYRAFDINGAHKYDK